MDLRAAREELLMMTIDEQVQRLTGIVESLAASVVAHDNQIGALLQIVEKHHAQIAADRERTAALERQWQAYINTLPRH
jgi:flagellar biosynthesis/type III secretory pathway chaperone